MRDSVVLAGDLKFGEVVYSMVSQLGDDGKSIKPGDKGIVQGPCNNPSLDRVSEGFLVEFDNGRLLNILAETLSRAHPSEVRPAYIARPHVLQGLARGNYVSILPFD